ncbi:hypothetical protein GCM10027589_35300 [Actinocorallia lasiicapitis]
MDVVVQWVRTSWSKNARGGPEAAVRNRAPSAFPLPEQGAPLLHEVVLEESDAFRPRGSHRPEPPGRAILDLREQDGGLRVMVVPNRWGAPRERRRPPAVRLARGAWLRWQINYRFVGASSGHWFYRLDTFNIAHGPAAPELFLGTPDRVVDERARLF